MAKKAIDPSIKLQKCYLANNLTSAQVKELGALIKAHTTSSEEETYDIIFFADEGELASAYCELTANEVGEDYTIEFQGANEDQSATYDYVITSVVAEGTEVGKWFDSSTGQLISETDEVEIILDAANEGVSEAVEQPITIETNEFLKDYIYMKEEEPEPTEDERLKTYMSRLKKFITLQEGKKFVE